MLKKMDAYAAQQLALIEEQFAQVAQELTQTGWISSGSVVRRFMPCGKPGCRCKANPPQLHGPYWQWTRALRGKTVTHRLNERQARLYLDWIANRRRLSALVAQLEELSSRAAEILLQDDEPARPDPLPQGA